MLIKSYVRKLVDSRRTLQVPSEMSAEFSQNLVMTATPGQGLSLHKLTHFEKVRKRIESLSSADPLERKIQRLMLGFATEIGVDKRGRLLIPAPLAEYAAISGETAILCVGNSARLVPRDKWKKLHTHPNSAESKLLLSDLTLPIFTGHPNPHNRAVETMKEILAERYHNLKVCQDKKDYREFEFLVGEIFECHNVGIVEVTQYSNDDGIDLVIYIDSESGVDVLFVQLKAGQLSATVSDLRELIGVISLHNGTAGLLISAGSFTSGAVKASAASKGTRIKADISDAFKLSSWIEHQLAAHI